MGKRADGFEAGSFGVDKMAVAGFGAHFDMVVAFVAVAGSIVVAARLERARS